MSDNREHASHEGHQGHEEHHIVPIWMYLVVFGILVVGTILTVAVALVDLDHTVFTGANTFVALLIAFVKMSFVVLFFMHVKYSGKMVWLCVVSSIFWLLIMFAFTMQDYVTRAPGTFS
jgi:cytochrome c oxidase subunit 4